MRSKFRFAILFGVLAVLISACTAKEAEPVDLAKTKTEIQAMEDAYAAAEKAKDANAVAAYYADEAISYNRNEEPTSGKAAIKDRIAKQLAADTTGNQNVYKVVDLFADGDMLVEIGSWTQVDASGAERNKGHYMSVFQKRDGKYLCVRDMNVSSTLPK